MSTLISTFIQDRASARTLGTERMVRGAVKAHAVINQTAQTLSFSLGISSITDGGLGLTTLSYSVSWTYGPSVAASSANYNVVVSYGSGVIACTYGHTNAYLDSWPQIICAGDIA